MTRSNGNTAPRHDHGADRGTEWMNGGVGRQLSRPAGSIDGDDQLAEMPPLLELLERQSRFVEAEHPVDHWAQPV
ncbi:hypothetical protein D3C85_960050 [compost metagenome]